MILTSHKANQNLINNYVFKSNNGNKYTQKKDAQAFDDLTRKFLER